MNPLLPRTSVERSIPVHRGRFGVGGLFSRSMRSAVVALVVAIGFGSGLGSVAVAQDEVTSIDQIMNSAEAKNDRTGAPAGNNLIALKTSAATDVSKRQRVLDRLSVELGEADVDCGQNAVLATQVADTGVVLNEIAGRIAAATDMKTARAAAAELFPKTRVFSLVQPQAKIALRCGDLAQQVLVLNGRIVAVQQAIESLKATPEVSAAQAQVVVASAAVKAIPTLAPASASVSGLLPDLGDATVANNNAATLNTARTQVNQAEALHDVAVKAVKDLERLTDQARKKPSTTKPKKKQK